MAGVISPQGMPSWDEFAGGVRAALDHVRHQHAGHNVLLVSSGGPISAAVGEVLGTAPEVTIALNMRIRNSAVTEFSVSPKRLMLQTFNTLPHLSGREHADWVTHA
jgi:broad specificity phosphatase PhoE